MGNRNLTVGKPSKVLWQFCLPIFASVIFQQLYNIADSFVAGKFISESALAAVGNSYEITLIYLAFGTGCNMGCSVVTSRLFGGSRYSDMKTGISTTFIGTSVICAILMTIGIVFCDSILETINTQPDIFADSALYLKVYTLGLPFVMFYNIANGVFTAMGDSRTPFVFLVCSSLGNIVMDILFVKTFGMGVAGVAWATFICQGIGCVLAVLFMSVRLSKVGDDGGKTKAFSWRIGRDIVRIAVPTVIQQSFISFGNIVIQSVINSFGSVVTAAYAGAIKLNNLIVTGICTTGNGLSNYTAQNVGAAKPERIHDGYKACIRIGLLLSIPFTLLYCFAGRYILLLFLEPGSETIGIAMEFLFLTAPFLFIVCFKNAADGVLRGLGRMGRFMTGTFVDFTIRVSFAWFLSKLLGRSLGIWLGWPFGWLVATLIANFFYFKCRREGYVPGGLDKKA